MSKFSDTLKLLRRANQLSQQDLATKLEISKSAVSMYEQGRREPDFVVLEKIADYFDVNTDYLLGRESNGQCPPPITIAAHLDTSDLTKAELRDVEDYIEFVRSRRKK